jgi:hypothetical protein
VQAGLETLVSDTNADEVIIVTDTYEHSDRMDSYQRVSRIAQQSDWRRISRRRWIERLRTTTKEKVVKRRFK